MRFVIALLLIAAAAPAQVAKFRVHETAGLRRFGYPVRTSIPPNAAPMRLLENGKPIPAQFTAVDGGIDIDFNVSLGPIETRDYTVEVGTPSATLGANGVGIDQADGVFKVHSSSLAVDIPENLMGLLSTVNGSKRTYVRPGSKGLVLNNKDGSESRLGDAKATVLKRGPLVCAIRFESARPIKSVVDMIFPRSKSWVEIHWSVDDPGHIVTGLGADLNLLLEGATTLVDFGANDTVYDALKPGQKLTFVASPADPGKPRWFVHLDKEPYASGPKPPEGWAHVMDAERATAIAVAGFGQESRDLLEASSDGHLLIHRHFAGVAARNLNFWMHFVPMPVQIGAATSPQSMQNPLQVEKQ